MGTTGATEGARILRQLRVRRGHSWAEQARAIHDLAREMRVPLQSSPASIQRTIARWEAGTSVPSERYQLILAHMYARTPAGAVVYGAGSDLDELLTAYRHAGVGEQRVEELRAAVARAGSDSSLLASLAPTAASSIAAALTDPRRLDPESVTGLEQAVRDVDQRVGSVPFVRLQVTLAPIIEILRRLDFDEVQRDIRPALHIVAAHAHTLAGRIAFETRDDAMAQQCYSTAVEHAGMLADRWHRAAVRVSQTMATLYATGDLTRAGEIADAAVRDAQRGGSYRVRARAHALQAEMAARAHRRREADGALRLAWHEVESDPAGDPAPNSMDAGRLSGFEGVCELHAGGAHRAHEQFERAAATLTGPRERVQRGIVLTDIALAKLRLAEPAAAATLLHDCIELTAETGGRVANQRIRHARLQLRPWRTEPFVADLDDHLHRLPVPL